MTLRLHRSSGGTWSTECTQCTECTERQRRAAPCVIGKPEREKREGLKRLKQLKPCGERRGEEVPGLDCASPCYNNKEHQLILVALPAPAGPRGPSPCYSPYIAISTSRPNDLLLPARWPPAGRRPVRSAPHFSAALPARHLLRMIIRESLRGEAKLFTRLGSSATMRGTLQSAAPAIGASPPTPRDAQTGRIFRAFTSYEALITSPPTSRHDNSGTDTSEFLEIQREAL